MSDAVGSLCIVLHGHLPYVLHHGTWPHGEDWLYEAAAEVYLPLLDVLNEVSSHRSRPGLTIGLTPVLLEQLAHERFKTGFVAFLKERAARAARDRAEFDQYNQGHFAILATRWEKWYTGKLDQFEKLGRNLIAPFAAHWTAGNIQLLTSNATHAYLPLLLNDQCITAQMSAGTMTSHKHLGRASRGMWLPECAYRPATQAWNPPALFGDRRFRPGLELFISNAGVDHFFIDTHMLAHGEALGSYENGVFREVIDEQIYWDRERGWRSPLEPVGVASLAQPPNCFALARHPLISEQVWNASIGYPGAGEYLEFHRKHGDHGLRYHRITDIKLDLSQKEHYRPEDTFARLFEHSQHFCNTIRQVLTEHHRLTGRKGICVAPFDAELFGHWWHEGPQFLRDVIFTLVRDKTVNLMTAEEALAAHPPDKVMRLPEGSWGKKGNHSVWMNDQTRWLWEIEYHAENRLLKLLRELPWRNNGLVGQMLERAGRELLLMQSSDWPFVIDSRGAPDYAAQRFAGHATRFERMANIAVDLASGQEIDPLRRIQIEETDAHDSIFPIIDLNWWT